ncbi:MAG: polyamine aminopropyltransferase [Desulfococcaceae bacterium]|nr:polyamine aminopropyltransferase [Desulfococcaceae bacterium]
MSSAGASDSLRIGLVLKIALFATGCAGIIAEFVLSTLATYLAGNAVFQWTIVMSLMLFAMGLGSRISRVFRENLLDTFIMVEFTLSILCAVSSVLVYSIAAWTDYAELLIYCLAFVIGNLIGLEIPLVTRLNEAYEELRINISAVLEKDYYGALLGGMIFAFIALPCLGLTYTPIVLGSINFLVAALILNSFFFLVRRKKELLIFFGLSLSFLLTLAFLAKPLILYGEQRKYKDKIIYSRQTVYQKIVMTQWKNFYWLYINGQEQFSTFDEEKYHEPLVHPAMKLALHAENVLIIGGGDGLALREILKYPDVKTVTLVDMDPVMTELAASHPVLTTINRGAMSDPRVRIINRDAVDFIQKDRNLYGVIIADLPDPDSVDLMHAYSLEFYHMIHSHLIKGGVFVTQATSPYFSKKAFLCMLHTVESAGFSVLPYHNQIPTMGEWGWLLGVKSEDADKETIRAVLMQKDYSDIETRFINRDAVISMLHFGKGVLDSPDRAEIRVNSQRNPVLYRYYQDGSWGIY